MIHMTDAVVLAGADPGQPLEPAAVRGFVLEQLATAELTGRSVCVLVPDATRSAPLPLLLDAVHRALAGRVSRLSVLIALGTHAPMDEAALAAHLGYPVDDLAGRYPGMTVRNHEWWDPAALTTVGTLDVEQVAEVSGGLLRRPVPVRLNRAVVEHDVVLVLGPVFPHEVVGFSGGNKYLVPGIAAAEVIDLSHWLGALITSREIIGTLGQTPVRELIDRAAALVPARRLALNVVVGSGTHDVHAVTFGDPEPSWRAAAEVSAQLHVRYLTEPVRRVVSVVATRYTDLWTAAKGVYKAEPVVADGGQIILYAPHVRQLSASHGEQIARIGYHCRDYFTAQWPRFAAEPWGVLAHSTHVRGAGTWSPTQGERCRTTVTLATGIDPQTVRAVGLDYLDPATVDPIALGAQPDTLLLENAGEILYRLTTAK
jgi:nickel-dependent lactate racemase